MIPVKISQNKMFNIKLGTKQVNMSISNEGVKFSRRVGNRRHTIRITWESLNKDFDEMVEQSLKK